MKKLFLIFLFAFFIFNIQAQNTSVIDDSKPTNFYTFFQNGFEYQNSMNGNIMGYRGSIALALDEKHLVYCEVPILYNDIYKKYGVGDMRYVYSYLAYKNYDRFFGVFMTSMDILAPTGNYNNGISADRWIFSPSIMSGLMVSDNFQFFPELSYKYRTKMVENVESSEVHGANFRLITPIIYNNKISMQITPNLFIFDFNNFDITYLQELSFIYNANDNLKLNMYYNINFEKEIYLTRINLKWFF